MKRKESAMYDSSPTYAFEFQILEVLLSRTVHMLRDECENLVPVVEHFLHESVSVHNVNTEMLTRMLLYSKLLTQLQVRLTSVRSAITEVLNSGMFPCLNICFK